MFKAADSQSVMFIARLPGCVCVARFPFRPVGGGSGTTHVCTNIFSLSRKAMQTMARASCKQGYFQLATVTRSRYGVGGGGVGLERYAYEPRLGPGVSLCSNTTAQQHVIYGEFLTTAICEPDR